ncbi:hypothetical protein F443_22698 [Phytophthora nicotianae P1569]|uniref:Chromo domain-containing protein n=1 Tax=Phytophthora nicotianae P1569 TaxID=1317065 RepID=V9DTK0_PHYNI|nr:hypothetical protein F443_22698 [Phytophthora nicotianae P1569]
MLDTRRIPSAHVTQAIDGKRAKQAARKVGSIEIVNMINLNVFNEIFHDASRLIVDKDTDESMHIEKRLRKRQFNRKPEWLVKWHGLSDHEVRWEREKDINHVSHWKVLIADFKKRQ